MECVNDITRHLLITVASQTLSPCIHSRGEMWKHAQNDKGKICSRTNPGGHLRVALKHQPHIIPINVSIGLVSRNVKMFLLATSVNMVGSIPLFPIPPMTPLLSLMSPDMFHVHVPWEYGGCCYYSCLPVSSRSYLDNIPGSLLLHHQGFFMLIRRVEERSYV